MTGYTLRRITVAFNGWSNDQGAAHIRSRSAEAREIAPKAGKRTRRWVVKRSHRWCNRFRRMLIRREKKPEHDLAFLHVASSVIAVRAVRLFG